MKTRRALISVLITLASLPSCVLSQACRPPSIVSEGRKVVFFTRDEGIRIPCVATGDRSLTYLWTKNGNPIDTSDFSNGGINIETGTGTIVIDSPHPSDAGYYQCHVTNQCGTALSVVSHVIHAFIHPFPPVSQPTVVEAAVGSSVVLTCTPPRSVPEPSMIWLLIGDDSSSYYHQLVTLDDRVTMDYFGNLYITNVHQDDSYGVESYACGATNHFTRSAVLGDDKRLVVRDNGSNTVSPTALLWSSPSDILALKGQEAKMKCIFAGNPLPSTSWERIDSQLDASRTFVDHNELVISDVQSSDSGVYRCSGLSSLDHHAVRRSFNLVVQSAPEWQSEPADITATSAGSAQFECSAVGIPEPTVQWFINGQPYQNLPDDPNRTLDGNILHFSSLDLSDSQVIQCNASNIHGYVWANAVLFVQG
ncbi:hypothetical protein RRG08_060268 [Elysia crispata]|uniref:Ig-like domain-containing protein n=1 Tax=Elysia crispata TaxID=231223 RepID=A0AAE1ECH0_9GAST|nr:hypothetical protein RRG08_060268 [Elysia crispata]